MSVAAEVTLILIAILLGLAIALIGIWICVRNSKQQRLAKAKAYFASLQTHDDNEEAKGDAAPVDEEMEYTDPNSFFSKEKAASKKDEEATIYEEAVNKEDSDSPKENNETTNEQALGNLF